MPTEIDNLQIKINADVQKANNAIDVLVGKLDVLTTSLGKIDGSKLTGLANGVNKLGSAVKVMGSVDSRHFSSLAKNITTLGNINTASINRAASSMNQLRNGLNSLGSVSQNAVQISEIASNISKLGGKNVTNAITNLPLLTTELNKFMSVMANSPQVSRNIIDMTNALANLAGQGRSVGAATNTLTNGLNKSNKAITKTSKSTISLASAFGKFYATYFLVIRGIKGLWSSIEKTADYFEALNYFNVAFDKIAGEWSQDYEKYGYENAEAYAESFTDRMEETFSKLSGVQFDTETGLLSDTGLKNLGLNIQEITQYASQLASVTNSLELTGEASLATSQAFTKLAGDMSSLFNVDYADVSANLQSGLIGQSRALYKYGIDITNATLQTKAYELGLTKAVSEMTQGEKAQLRLLSILEQSKIAWGDQANTINSLSNQMRLLKNGWSETSMIFGQLFVPMLEDALPIINGLVIALKRLLINVAGFMGVEIDPNKFNTGLNNNEEVLDGIADGFEDATAAAKEYENQILGFDEITKLQDTTATVGVNADGTGIDLTQEILDATSEYERVWSEAYANMENRAEEWADKISEFFGVGDWFGAGETSSEIAIGIFNGFSNALKKVDWDGIGEGVGDFLAGIKWLAIFESLTDVVGSAIEGGFKFWFNSLKEAPIETALITSLAVWKFTNFGKSLGDKLSSALANNGISVQALPLKIASVILTWEVGFDIGKEIGKLLFPENADWYDDFTWFGEGGAFETLFGKTENIDRYAKEFEYLAGQLNALNLEIENNRSLAIVDYSSQIKDINDLANSYFDLADKESLDVGEKTLLIAYANELVNKIPELKGLIDEETGAYTAQKEEIEKVIEAQRRKIMQNVADERQAQILEDIISVNEELNDKQKEYADATKKYSSIVAKYEARDLELKEQIAEYQKKIANPDAYDPSIVQRARQEISLLIKEQERLPELQEEELAQIRPLIQEYEDLQMQIRKLELEYNVYDKVATGEIKTTQQLTTELNNLDNIDPKINVIANTNNALLEIGNLETRAMSLSRMSAIVNVDANTTSATSKINNVSTLLGNIKDKTISLGGNTAQIDSALNTLRTKLLNYELPTLDIKALIKTDLDEKAFKDAVDKMGPLGALSSNIFSPAVKSGLSVGSFATGGFVDSYSLFMAGENGVPELLGTVGGRTAVAGGAEITGIREEIRNSASEEIALLRQQNTLLQGILEKQYGISYKDVGRAVKRYSSEYRMQTGQSFI